MFVLLLEKDIPFWERFISEFVYLLTYLNDGCVLHVFLKTPHIDVHTENNKVSS